MVELNKTATSPPDGFSKKEARKQTKTFAKRLGKLHNILLAQKKYAVLVILQGMDASGKDGAVKNVFRYCTPNNLSTYSFKKPTEEEFAHDFLWRVHKQCPLKGEMKIFNRSHYEDILIQRVHQWIDEDKVQQRMQAINAFEKLLQFDNNTVLFKFFLHISKEQQEIELNQRKTEADKFWKHNDNDWREREYWDEYMRCYQDAINQSEIPWYIIPTDKRWYRDYLISKIMVEKLEQLDLKYPPL